MVLSVVKWLAALPLCWMLVLGNMQDMHPLHVSVVEVEHNATDKTLEVSCKLFTDDFETILAKNYKTKVDLVNPPDRDAMDKLISDFVRKHLALKTDDKQVQLNYLGYERDKDAVYSYFEVTGVSSIKKITAVNQLMYELFTDQINLLHITVGGKRKSTRLVFPDKDAEISF
jgi:hypothetical protein